MKLIELQNGVSLWRVYVEADDRSVAVVEANPLFRSCSCFHYCWELAQGVRGKETAATCEHVKWLCGGDVPWTPDVYESLADVWRRYGVMGKQEQWDANGDDCPICLTSEVLPVERGAHCVHQFHKACIHAWHQRARGVATCPLCRAVWV